MNQIALGRYRTARIWQEELPNAGFDPIDVLSYESRSDVNLSSNRKQAFCIEYRAHLGGRIAYGLLGSTLRDTQSGAESVHVLSNDQDCRIFQTDLSFPGDRILIGLPAIFASSVLSSAKNYISEHTGLHGWGRLTFHCAAFSEFGSSQHVFEQLAAVNCHYYFAQNPIDEVKLNSLLH